MRKTLLCAILALAVPCVLTGCQPKKTDDATKKDGENGHAHPTKGPHGGPLVELGDEEYHAELVEDEKTETMTIYILDDHAEKIVAIDAKELVINLKHDGEDKPPYKLLAVPDEKDPEGKSSRFVLKSEDLLHDLGHDDADAKLVVKIGEKSYIGDIKPHDHEHKKGGKH